MRGLCLQEHSVFVLRIERFLVPRLRFLLVDVVFMDRQPPTPCSEFRIMSCYLAVMTRQRSLIRSHSDSTRSFILFLEVLDEGVSLQALYTFLNFPLLKSHGSLTMHLRIYSSLFSPPQQASTAPPAAS